MLVCSYIKLIVEHRETFSLEKLNVSQSRMKMTGVEILHDSPICEKKDNIFAFPDGLAALYLFCGIFSFSRLC